MSSFSRKSARGLILAACLSVAACGFQPLYAPHGDSAGVAHRLETVRVEQIGDRNGQVLTNQLRDALAPRGAGATPGYQLAVRLKVATVDLLGRPDGTATRTSITVHAEWTLTKLTDNSVVLRGTSEAVGGHNVIESNDYANVVASDSDTARGLRDVADDIEQRLAAYFVAQT